ncbi:SDR family oxidoreductase [Chitinophaga sancti]|uniref:NAD(P)-dependent dehydrogenase, short-chain alcohol dehydrogenase family n=1 Tax=Chitinophaga sancti TaxID=1004 RepID=A0A1K1RMC0_9BACT|nr:SDR family oxidoreductase [Chitinophaga sancti]WQD62623.1 SDR family oxidoreductase [Chitinophaga sancti]WQG91807.1 SDR family oxidoreductase [Chitinophaga sancti]SFW73419.1 NAD(P)-dependent dehydrogenase, short-chain alcohol dehydrogenase family [Chitinophaga sancti]
MDNQTTIDAALAGKIALVTGGTKGIGKAVVKRLEQAGATVIVIARNQPEDPQSANTFIAADLARAEEVSKVADIIKKQFGRIDIIINNMGANTYPGGGFSTLTDEDWNQALQVNLLSSVRLDRALLPMMLAQQSGVIIHVSTTSSQFPIWEATMAYSTAKSALNTYSKALATEVASKGVRVVTVSPGLNKTEAMTVFLEDLARQSNSSVEETTAKLFERVGGVPIGRMAAPEETAELIYFLVTPAASYITGANLVIDGGNFPVVK